jgi:hypothetical protein
MPGGKIWKGINRTSLIIYNPLPEFDCAGLKSPASSDLLTGKARLAVAFPLQIRASDASAF